MTRIAVQGVTRHTYDTLAPNADDGAGTQVRTWGENLAADLGVAQAVSVGVVGGQERCEQVSGVGPAFGDEAVG